MRLKKIQEGKTKLYIPVGPVYGNQVFYNPAAQLTRDISVCAVQAFQKQFKEKLNICDALAGTGIRGLRYAAEVSGVKKVILNDKNPAAFELIKKNIKLNGLEKRCVAKNIDANLLLSKEIYNVVDIDPFGPPVSFLDSAARAVFWKGFLAVTATDLAPLCGTYPLSCFRKYGITSLKTDYYAELGIRILISKIILSLAKHEKAFNPVLAFATQHYFRVFGQIIRGNSEVNRLLKQFGFVSHCLKCGNRKFGKIKEKCSCGKRYNNCGPVYLGKINDKKFCKEVLKEAKSSKLLTQLVAEADLPAFYYDLHQLAKKWKKPIPKTEKLINKLKQIGFKSGKTHFCQTAIKTNAGIKEIKKLFI